MWRSRYSKPPSATTSPSWKLTSSAICSEDDAAARDVRPAQPREFAQHLPKGLPHRRVIDDADARDFRALLGVRRSWFGCLAKGYSMWIEAEPDRLREVDGI